MTATTLSAHSGRVQKERRRIVPAIVHGVTFDAINPEVGIVHRQGVEAQRLISGDLVEALMTAPAIGLAQGILHMIRLVEIPPEPNQCIARGQQLHLGTADNAHATMAIDATESAFARTDGCGSVHAGEALQGSGVEARANRAMQDITAGQMAGIAEIVSCLEGVAAEPGRAQSDKPQQPDPSPLRQQHIPLDPIQETGSNC